MTDDDLINRFTHHPPADEQTADRHADIRLGCLDLAKYINQYTANSREKSLAITTLEEVMFWANAAVARHGLPT